MGWYGGRSAKNHTYDVLLEARIMTTFRSTFTTIAVAAIAYLHLPTALANETANARTTQQRHSPLHPKADEFALVFQDEFNGSALDWNVWDSEDGVKRSPSGQRTRRSPANVTVEDGLLKLNVRKELVNGADWTAAYVWLRENFGPNTYYEARFVNTKATGINNAFWFATRTAERKIYRDRYEIDCPENKLHEDGTVHAHLAWHDWKSYRRSDGQHVAQGMRVILEDTGFQTWGVWIGENEFAIYCEGELVWDGTTHAKYHDQWQTGMGKLARWTNDEEQRAYGKHGQDDWSYFGGMNGDVLNLCLATIPWQSKGSPLTDDADGTFMGVDYIRVYKPKAQLSWKPTQKLQTIPPGKPIGLKSPVVLSEAGTEYFSFLVRAGADLPVKCMCKSGERTVCTLAVEPDGLLKLTSNHGNASTAVSYPARTLNRQAWQTGTEHLVVCRITANESGRDIISVATFPTSDPLPVLEPYLYPNIDEHGNTSITNQWDLSVKSTVDGTIDSIRFDFDPDAAACRCFQAGRGFTSVAAGNRRHAHRHIGKPIDLVDVPADLVLPTLTDDEPAAGKRVRMQLPGWAQSEVYHSLYLPYNWTPGRTYPVIVEFPGNGPFHNRFGDICDGIVDNAALGYGLTEGTDFIWIVVAPISEDRSRNQRYWWGDIDATVDYCIDAVRHTCREYGGDPDRVVLTGFSRGAIGIGYVGLHNDEIAGLWRAFIHYSGYDGVREWNYPKSSRTDALERFERHGDRPALVIDDGSTAAKERYIQSTGTEAPFTFLSTGFRNHNDKWVLRDVPARAAARAWLAGVTRLGATQSVGGSAAPKGEVVHVAEHGAMPNDGHCDRDAIQAAVDQAIALQQRSDAAVAIEFAAGVYNLREPKLERDGKQRLASHIIIKDATNLTLRGAAKANGEPATVLERNVPKLLSRMALARLVHVDGGTNVALQNVVLDNNPRFASAGVCVLVDEANDAVEVDVFDGVPHFDGMDAFSANVWDLKTRDLRPGVPHLSIGTSYRGFPVQWRHVPGGKGRRYRIERMGFAAHLNVGDGVSWHFNVETPAHNMLRAKSTDTLTLENVYITNGPAAVVTMNNVGNLTCRRVKLAPVGSQLAVGPSRWDVHRRIAW